MPVFCMSIFTLLNVTKVCSALPLRLSLSDFWNSIFVTVEPKGCELVSQILPQSLILKLKLQKIMIYFNIIILFVIHFSFHESPIFPYTKLYVFFIQILEE
jgi:hypothetical protein